MKKLYAALFTVGVLMAGNAHAVQEPNYFDVTDVYNSLQKIRKTCPATTPECGVICSEALTVTMQMNNGGNVTPQKAAKLKKAWWNCYKARRG